MTTMPEALAALVQRRIDDLHREAIQARLGRRLDGPGATAARPCRPVTGQ
jgi:hypothetical protein